MVKVFASQLIPLSPIHPPNPLQSQKAAVRSEEDLCLMPRNSQSAHPAGGRLEAGKHHSFKPRTAEIQGTPVYDRAGTPSTARSQNLAASQAQFDEQAPQDYSTPTPSPKKHGDNTINDLSVHRGQALQSRSASTRMRSHSFGTLPLVASYGQVGLDDPKSQSMKPQQPHPPGQHHRPNESEDNFERMKTQQWKERQQRMLQRNIQQPIEANAKMARKRSLSESEEGSRKKTKTKATDKRPIVKKGRSERSLAGSKKSMPTAIATSTQKTLKQAKTDEPSNAAKPMVGQDVSSVKKANKLVDKLRQDDGHITSSNTSTEIDHQSSKRRTTLKKAASKCLQNSTKIGQQESRHLHTDQDLSVFDIHSESESEVSHKSSKVHSKKTATKRWKKRIAASGSPRKAGSSSKEAAEMSSKQDLAKSNRSQQPDWIGEASRITATPSSPLAQKSSSRHLEDGLREARHISRVLSPSGLSSHSLNGLAPQTPDQLAKSRSCRVDNWKNGPLESKLSQDGATTSTVKFSKKLDIQGAESPEKGFEGAVAPSKQNDNTLTKTGYESGDTKGTEKEDLKRGPAHFQFPAENRTNLIESQTRNEGSSTCEKDYVPSQMAYSSKQKNVKPATNKNSHPPIQRKRLVEESEVASNATVRDTSVKRQKLNSTGPSSGQLSESYRTVHERVMECKTTPEVPLAGSHASDAQDLQSPVLNRDQKRKGSLFHSRNSAQSPSTAKTEQASSAGVNLKLQWEGAPQLPPRQATLSPVRTSPCKPLTSHAKERVIESAEHGKPLFGLINERVHRKPSMVHFTAKDSMNQGSTAGPISEPRLLDYQEGPTSKKRSAGEPLEITSTPREVKRLRKNIKNARGTTNSRQNQSQIESPITQNQSQAKRALLSRRSTQISETGSPLPVTTDECGRQQIIGQIPDDEDGDMSSPPTSAHSEPASSHPARDDDSSNVMASYHTVPTQILTQAPNILPNKVKARPQSPTAESQAISCYASEEAVEQSARKAELESVKEKDPFASSSRYSPQVRSSQSGYTRFMRSLQAQMKAQVSPKRETEYQDVRTPEITLVEGEQALDSDSFTSTELVEVEEDEVDAERREAMEWEDSLRGHQLDVAIALRRISRELVHHLISTDEAVDDILDDYRKRGEELVQSMRNAHVEEYMEYAQELQGQKDVVRKLLQGVEATIGRAMKDVKTLRTINATTVQMQEKHDGLMNGLRRLAAGL